MSKVKATEIALEIMKYTSPLGYLIYDRMVQSSNAVSEASHGDLAKFKEEVDRKEIELEFAKKQAQVEQELAIARRIDNAEEVEIEEYYDLSGKGNLGVNLESKSVGISAEGNRVSKRIYRFKSKSNDITES